MYLDSTKPKASKSGVIFEVISWSEDVMSIQSTSIRSTDRNFKLGEELTLIISHILHPINIQTNCPEATRHTAVLRF